MANDSSRIFLRLSDVYGVKDDELKAVIGAEIEIIGITRGHPSAEYANEECAVVTLRGDRRSVKAQVEQRFQAFKHPEREPSPDFDFKGFTPLTNEHDESDPDLIDVIAVPGLGGNAFATWQGQKKGHLSHWLRDFLPHDLNNARVWIYGYKSDLNDDSNMAGTLHFAQRLRGDLVATAKRHKMQNIILMGHSLGCILIKKALVDLPQEDELFKSLITLVFFGAPHKGFDIRALSDYAYTTLRQQRIQTIISELGADSAFLGSLHNDFLDCLDVSLPHIITVYETRSTPTLAQNPVTGIWARTGPAVQAVPLSSARLDLQRKHETLLPAPYDHSGIAKVTKDADHVYYGLVNALNEVIRKRKSRITAAATASSLSLATSSSQGLVSSHSTGMSSSNLSLPSSQWSPNNVERLFPLQNSSWTSVPPVSNAMDAAIFQALSTGSVPKSPNIPLLSGPLETQTHAIATTPLAPSPPLLERIVTLSPATSVESPPSANQQIKRGAIPVAPHTTLSTIYPSAGLGVQFQYGQQNKPIHQSGSVISLPDSVESHSSKLKNDWPEAVERHDWPENLSSLPCITLRPAPTVKDYKPFRFEPVTRYLHHPSLAVIVRRDATATTQTNTGITPFKFQTHTVSNPHCEFSYRNNQWYVRDLGSSNGTWLNGVRLSDSKQASQRHLIQDQDLIKLGSQYQDGKDNHQRCVRMLVSFSDE